MKKLVLGALLFGLAACSQGGTMTGGSMPAADLKAQIDANNAAWSVAANRGDAAAVAALYTEDATMLPPGMDIQHGRAAIEQAVATMGKSGIRNFSLVAQSVSQVGPDTAVEIGRFSVEAMGPRKKWVPVDGKYVVVWKQVGGRWLLNVDIWNMNK